MAIIILAPPRAGGEEPEPVAYVDTDGDTRLLLAAPDLLAAVRFCLEHAGGPPVDMLSRLRAAYHKATGETL